MNPNNQFLFKCMIGLVIVAGVTAAFIIIAGEFNSSTSIKMILIAFSLLFYSATSCFCLAVIQKNQYRLLGNIGIIISMIAFILNVLLIVAEFDLESNNLLKLAYTFAILAITFAYLSFIFYVNTKNKYAVIARIIGVICISLFSFMQIIKMFEASQFLFFPFFDESSTRFTLALLFIGLASSILIPLCNRLLILNKGVTVNPTDMKTE